MAERETELPGVTPHITIGGGRAAEAMDFYARAFGAEEQMRMPAQDGRRLMHGALTVNGGTLMLADHFPEYEEGSSGQGSEDYRPAGTTLHLQVDDADRWFDRAVAAGAEEIMRPQDMFWGDRYGQVRDPFGHRWSIGSPVEKD